MNCFFMMDPLATVQDYKDTSFAFMEEASKRKHRVYFVSPGGVDMQEGRLVIHATEVTPARGKQPLPFELGSTQVIDAIHADAFFIRTEPPFDASYLMDTWILDQLPKTTYVMNHPSGIRTVNEKIWAMQFTELIPPSLLTHRKKGLHAFLNQQEKIVIKPTDGFGGQGVFIMTKGDTNASVIFETMTQNESRKVIAQRFLPEASQGDKRILLLAGEPLGAVLRVHGEEDHRNNFFAGGHAQKAVLSQRDLEIVQVLQPHLKKQGLDFVGLDIMGSYLIEVNVTSPTCIQEMSQLDGIPYTEKVLDYVEQQVKERRQYAS